ncbi:hypothetical protein EVAR_5140_1 [Eumeta japonica]|uniref:Uncharacterized protein n=1 Tax=Eumeta variegata TaxID=151549 RepID=A0A4C1SXW2_EUMVA|nr:hypothetical protein EVAR_5140_1 [Eumeta japonica]
MEEEITIRIGTIEFHFDSVIGGVRGRVSEHATFRRRGFGKMEKSSETKGKNENLYHCPFENWVLDIGIHLPPRVDEVEGVYVGSVQTSLFIYNFYSTEGWKQLPFFGMIKGVRDLNVNILTETWATVEIIAP